MLALVLASVMWGRGEEMETVKMLLPPSLFAVNAEGKLAPGVKDFGQVKAAGMTLPAYDVREWYQSVGIAFPEGAQAIFFPDQCLLIFKNTKDNVELLDNLIDDKGSGEYSSVLTEYFLVRFGGSGDRLRKDLTYEELREVAGSSWDLVRVLSCLGKSGTRSSAALSGTESSAKVDTEAVTGPDGVTVNVKYSYTFQGGYGDGKAVDLKRAGEIVISSGQCKVLSIHVGAAQAGASYAVVMRASVQLPGNVTRPAKESEKQ